MFQGMFRKRGRPPDPPLQIGGYDKPTHEESEQIPAHQLRETPRQLPLPPVREFEQNAIVQQERSGLNNAIVEPSSSQQVQQDVNMVGSQDGRLMKDPRHFERLAAAAVAAAAAAVEHGYVRRASRIPFWRFAGYFFTGLGERDLCLSSKMIFHVT